MSMPSSEICSTNDLYPMTTEIIPKLRAIKYRHGEWILLNFPTPSIILNEKNKVVAYSFTHAYCLVVSNNSAIFIYNCVILESNASFIFLKLKTCCSQLKTLNVFVPIVKTVRWGSQKVYKSNSIIRTNKYRLQLHGTSPS